MGKTDSSLKSCFVSESPQPVAQVAGGEVTQLVGDELQFLTTRLTEQNMHCTCLSQVVQSVDISRLCSFLERFGQLDKNKFFDLNVSQAKCLVNWLLALIVSEKPWNDVANVESNLHQGLQKLHRVSVGVSLFVEEASK